MGDGFYRALEERFRGSRELVRARLGVYRPFVAPLARPRARVLDLGCGRGEWLEVLGEEGFEAFGVDLDEGMLAACRERGLAVAQADAVATLEGVPPESLSVVSAFHLVEHLPFATVRRIVAAALRALEPGGLLILETPNPENVLVAARDFYLDPTHVRPIPAALLAFVAEEAGFARTKVLFLQEPEALARGEAPGLYEVLAGVSPDYAVVAQKGGAAAGLMAALDAAFAAEYGSRLEPLARRYDEVVKIALQQAATGVHGARSLAEEARWRADGAQESALAARSMAEQAQESALAARSMAEQAQRLSEEALQKAVEVSEQLQAQVQALTAQLLAVYASRSWRITAPLRAIGQGGRRVREGVLRALLSRSWVRAMGKWALAPFPGLRARLLRAALGGAVTVESVEQRVQSPADTPYERRMAAALARAQQER